MRHETHASLTAAAAKRASTAWHFQYAGCRSVSLTLSSHTDDAFLSEQDIPRVLVFTPPSISSAC